jgi:hypothetical protein
MRLSSSYFRLKQVAYLAGVLVPALLATASAAPPADEVFSVIAPTRRSIALTRIAATP